MKVRSYFESTGQMLSVVGSAEAPVRKLVTDAKGVKKLVEVGVQNLQDQKNSYRDACDIYKLLGDFIATNGGLPTVDISNKIIDVSHTPTTIFEYNEIVNNAKAFYNAQPADLRSEMAFGDFVQNLFTDSGQEKIKKYFKKSEVNNDESAT